MLNLLLHKSYLSTTKRLVIYTGCKCTCLMEYGLILLPKTTQVLYPEIGFDLYKDVNRRTI